MGFNLANATFIHKTDDSFIGLVSGLFDECSSHQKVRE